MARLERPSITAINIRPVLQPPLVEGILTVRRVYAATPERVERRFEFDRPTVYTRNNAMFAATHLGLIMGAAKICYIGVEQRNALHYYNMVDEYKKEMFKHLNFIINEHAELLGLDHPYENPYEMFRRLFESPKELAERQFYEIDHTQYLAQWLALARDRMGTTSVSAVADSVVCDAGAPHQPLAHVVERDWCLCRARADPFGAGAIDILAADGDGLRFAGWAADLTRRCPAADILLMRGDRLLLRAKPAGSRPDVADRLANDGFTACGFDIQCAPGLQVDSQTVRGLRAYGKTHEGALFRLELAHDR
jgi:hypothetical protein